MNNERFIEMLNLYIDRELGDAEVREVEEAIESSPERQRIYAQYCRMERATKKLLAETQIPQPDIENLVASARAAGNELEFPEMAAPRRSRWVTWGGSFAAAAAACLAVVFSYSTLTTAQNSDEQSSPAPTYAATIPAAPAMDTDEIRYHTVFVLASDTEEDRLPGMSVTADSFAWMAQLQFAPIERAELDDWSMLPAEPIQVRSLNDTRWVSPVGLDDSPPREAVTAFQFQR